MLLGRYSFAVSGILRTLSLTLILYIAILSYRLSNVTTGKTMIEKSAEGILAS